MNSNNSGIPQERISSKGKGTMVASTSGTGEHPSSTNRESPMASPHQLASVAPLMTPSSSAAQTSHQQPPVFNNSTTDSIDPSIEALNHGMALDPQNKRVQCCYCGKVVKGFDRLQHHLGGGIRGNVSGCQQVPPEIKEIFRKNLISTEIACLVREVGDSYQNNPPPKRVRTSIDHHGNADPQTSSSARSKRCIGRFFFENGFDFRAVESLSFKTIMEISMNSSEVNDSIPSISELKGWIIDAEFNEIKNHVEEIRLSWPCTGCSIVLDGWTDQLGRSLINVIVDCPKGPVYIRSADVSPLTMGDNALQLLLESVLEEVGVENVVQIISHTSSETMDAVSKQLIEKYRTLFWTVSATHCISLMLEKIAVVDSIKMTLDKAKMVTKFIYSRDEILKLLRSKIGSHDLVKSSTVKAAASFLTLENFFVEKRNLEAMFTCSQWLNCSWASTSDGQMVANLIRDNCFWDGVIIAMKASIPLVRALSLINGDGEPQIGFIYETMDQVKETISEEFGGKKSMYMPFWKIIDEIWNTILHSPIHAAGYFLNPRLYYTEDFSSDTEVTGGLFTTIVRMVEEKHAQDLISKQVDEYGACKDAFKAGTETKSHHALSPASWWLQFGGHCPELQKMAVKILSQTCNGAETYQLRRDLAEKLLSGRRNILEQRDLHKLAFIHYNTRLRQSKVGGIFNIVANLIDPCDDWIVDEQYQGDGPSGGVWSNM